MKKFRCTVCGYVYEGENPPACCPTCRMPATKFVEAEEKKIYAADHVVGVSAGIDPEALAGLRANAENAGADAAKYLAMARVAEREGYMEAACAFRRFAGEKAETAALYYEMLGDGVNPDTKENLESAAKKAYADTESQAALAKLLKSRDLDAIHDAVHEAARNEARYGQAFEGLLRRNF